MNIDQSFEKAVKNFELSRKKIHEFLKIVITNGVAKPINPSRPVHF